MNNTPLTLDQEYVAEAFIMALFGLSPDNKNDVRHLAELRKRGLPFVRLSHKVRLYPRAEVSAFLSKNLYKSGQTE
jgi:hypothetical protein